MSADRRLRLAILYPGDRVARDRSDAGESRFATLFDAFAAADVLPEPAIYHDDFSEPPWEKKSMSGISSCMSGVGTPTSTTVPARSRA